jgi:hypothetical protein
MKDKGRYRRFVCVACIALIGLRLCLDVHHAADVIARPAGTTVIGADGDQPILLDIDNWLGSDPPRLPPEQIIAFPQQYMRPVLQRYIFGTPPLFLGWQIDDELPVAA